MKKTEKELEAKPEFDPTQWACSVSIPPLMQVPRSPDFAAIAARLLPFEEKFEHLVWPFGLYRIGVCKDPSAMYGALYSSTEADTHELLMTTLTGTRAQAVAACRSDLALRLSAVRELEADHE